MYLPPFEYVRPQSVAEACRALEAGRGTACAIAGGTDLLMALKNRQRVPGILVDMGNLPGLDHLEYSPTTGLKIGALVSLRRLAADATVRETYPVLVQAALSVGSAQLQAMGTVGGNLCQDTCCMFFNRSATERRGLEPCHKLEGDVCHVVNHSAECWATYAGDLAPALLALNADVTLQNSNGGRNLPLRDLFSGDGKHPLALRPDELITEIRVPSVPPLSTGVYLKLRQRETLDYPLLGVALQLTLADEEGLCRHAGLALTAVDKQPVFVTEAERLVNTRLSAAVIRELAQTARRRAHPLKNLCGLDRNYRNDMVAVYVERAFQMALGTLCEGTVTS